MPRPRSDIDDAWMPNLQIEITINSWTHLNGRLVELSEAQGWSKHLAA